MENACPNWMRNSCDRSLGRPRLHLVILCEVLKTCLFGDCLGRQEVDQKSEMSATLADNLIPMGSFGWVDGRGEVPGRRERRVY